MVVDVCASMCRFRNVKSGADATLKVDAGFDENDDEDDDDAKTCPQGEIQPCLLFMSCGKNM